MAEPIPSASAAGEEQVTNDLPKNAEDRKAAAALNALNTNEMSQDSGETNTKSRTAADQEALDKAMSRLEMASGLNKKKEDSTKKTDVKKEAEVKKKIKIASEDVNFLVTELDLSKNKATELLRAAEGDAIKAIRTFMTPDSKIAISA